MLEHSPFSVLLGNHAVPKQRKLLPVIVTAAIVWMFGDHSLDYLMHALHLLLEVVESLLDHFFAEVVGLSHRQAEVVTAYTGLATLLFVLYRLAKKVYALYCRLVTEVGIRWRRFSNSRSGAWLIHHWRWLAASAGALGLSYLFMF